MILFHSCLVHASTSNLSPWNRVSVYLSLCAVSNHIRRFKRPEYIAHRDFTPIECLPDDCLLKDYDVAVPWKDGTPASALVPGGLAIARTGDELQYVEEEELAALITALHRTAQRLLPVVLVGGWSAATPRPNGTRQILRGAAVRLSRDRTASRTCGANWRSRSPSRRKAWQCEEAALQLIVQETRGYPYFLQEWGKHAWDIATASPITRHDVALASKEAVAALDESFFRVRFDRLTPAEKSIPARDGGARTRAASFGRHRGQSSIAR